MSPLILFLFGTLPVCGTNLASRIGLGVYADFQYEPPAGVQQSIEDELAAIMIPIGPTPAWRSLAGNRGCERWARLVVVHFKGRCDLSDLAAYPPYQWTLGRTHIADGEVLPFSDIYCGAIRAFLAPILLQTEEQSRSFVLGRAIGRVLAHELYHVLAKTRHHGGSGLGESAYKAEELAGDEFAFDEAEIRRLRGPTVITVKLTGHPRPPRCPGAGE